MPANQINYNRKELDAIIELDGHLFKFPPLLAIAVAELRKKSIDLAINFLLGKTENDWADMIQHIPGTIHYPNQYNSSPTPVQDYARDIVYSLTNKYPISGIIAKIGETGISTKEVIKTILGKNTDFDITKQAAHTWFKVVPNPVNSNEISDANLKIIQELQRCIKLTEGVNKFNQIEALMLSGYTSAYMIFTTGKYDFKNVMKEYGLSDKETNFIICRAKTIYDTVNYLSVQHIRYDSNTALVPQALQYGSQAATAPLQIPDLQTIFGSLNTCSCTDCQSVYSAAAYLADLLHWTKSDVVCQDSGVNAYSVLTGAARRPDIPYILLNCKNTNTLMPYIDLVNEILSINLTGSPQYYNLQTTGNTEDLMIMPENRFPLAEASLKNAYFPWVLPYDSVFDEATTYLEKLGMKHHELINSFSKQDDKYNNIYWAKAYLNLNEEEYKLIINDNNTVSADANFWKDYWGMDNAPTNIGPVLKNAELQIEELKELLQSAFITNSTASVNNSISIITPTVDDCNIDNYTFSPAFGKPVAERFLRFLRLKRKCGLSVWELDLAIRNLGLNIIDESFIISLSTCITLNEKHNISFSDLMLWFNENAYQDLLTDIAIQFKPTPYFKNKFQNKLLSDDIKTFFNPAETGNCFNSLIASLTDSDKQKLATVLNIGISEFDILTGYFITSSSSTFSAASTLNAINISRYDRYAKFSRVFGIEISEMIALFNFITDPFIAGPVTPYRIWSFSYQWDEFKKLNQKPSEFKDILLGKGYFELDVDGKAVNIDFGSGAKDLWEKVKDAIYTTRMSFPNGYNAGNQPDLTIFPNAPFLETIVYQELANKFDLNLPVVKTIIEHSFNSWVGGVGGIGGYISDTATWVWTATIEGDFTPVYRLLRRVSLLSGICGLDAAGLQSGVNIKFTNTTLTFTSDEDVFYWLTNDFTTLHLPYYLSIKKVTHQAVQLGISQDKYFDKISVLLNHPGDFSDTDIQTFAGNLYLLLGEDSELKKLSAFEFENIYFRAQSIPATHNELITVMEAFISIFGAMQIIGAGIGETWSWIWNDWPLTGMHTQAIFENYNNDLRRILHTRHVSADAWIKFILPIQNGFRGRLRDALVAYYIGKQGFINSNDIYDHFLLDTEMEPCMKTSRIVMAISSVQLLIHRALTGIEPNVCMDEDDKNEWEWRKNYRVWEANRKIFLYPENWIEPSLRLDKSPFFKEAEDLLLQDEVNDENCEKAFSGYLSNLNETARLDIRGTYIDETSNPPVVHIFGRTWNAPYIYYYRKREKNVWSSWEKLELDIEGDHIIPLIFNRRLYLIWPMFIEKEHRKIKRVIDDVEQNAPYYEIKMCYSKLEFGKWTSKKILNGTMFAGQYCGLGVFNNLERKLGKGIPASTLSTIINPDFDLSLWNFDHFRGWDPTRWRGGYPDPFAPHGPLKLVWIPGDTHRGNLVFDNVNFQDYSYVNLDKKSFFFWGEVNKDSGDVIIQCRRDFHPDLESWHLGYTELAYEDGFKISACDEKVEIIPPVITEPGLKDKRFLARPFLTLPDAMLLKQGLDRVGEESPDDGLFVKKTMTHAPDKIQLFGKTNPVYTLTYPHQYKDALWDYPFFFSDKKHTFFLERKKDKICVCTTLVLVTTAVPVATTVPGTTTDTGNTTLTSAVLSATTGPVTGNAAVTTPVPVIAIEHATTNAPVTELTNSHPSRMMVAPARWEIDCHYVYPTSNKFSVMPHEHPFSCTMLAEFNRYGIKGLLDSQNLNIRRQLKVENYFKDQYLPISTYINPSYPANEYDFDRDGAYSIYNWEIFFHLVSVIGRQLRQNNKFAEAIKWLQFVFDPKNRESSLGTKRVWKTKPFMIDVANGSIQYLMRLLSSGGLTREEEAKREELTAQIEDWRDNPFEPHRIASMRHRAYMLWTVMEYIDTLTDWADWLFRQDTMESINEAANLYILAAKLLGDRPEKISKTINTDISFNQIASGIDSFSNASVHMENQMTGMTFQSNCTCGDNPYQNNSGYSLPNLLFCIPDNPKLLEYWNRVEDRLFKIRHCMNIDGQIRELALFSPPIDPALLVRARALGLDISEILSDLASPSPHYRFSYLLQKAADFCNEVKSLGGQLLSAFEKRDAEELTLIRQLHEQNILKASRNLKQLQIDEAKQTLASLEHSKKLIQIRLSDYENRAYVSSREQITIDHTKAAEGYMYGEQGALLLSAILGLIPQVHIGIAAAVESGGITLAKLSSLAGQASGTIGSVYRNKASMSATYAGYDRRQEDWNLQIKTANEELNQNEVQMLGAEIRIAINEKELENHDLQVEQSKEIYDWIKSKFTNHDLYSWMSGELMKLHHKAYELAYDMAKLAQRAFDKELNGTATPVQFGNWDSGKKGLLAGDQLSIQLKDLEANYMKLNKREFELTKTISIKLLNPQALIDLISTGTCSLELPDWLFSLEFPDEKLYAMRVKSVAVSVPCITGPQTSTNVKLKMLKSWIGWTYSEQMDFTNSPSINEEIITSSAVNDPAVFEMNLRDERYMPFENQGVVSKWEISLPNQHEFDYSTISDLVLHIRYVAKGISIPNTPQPILRNVALEDSHQFMSLKHDFPMEWHTIVSNSISSTPALTQLKGSPPLVTPVVIPLISSLATQFIPYKVRLAGKQSGLVDKVYFLYKDNDGKIMLEEVSDLKQLLINNLEIRIGGIKVEDIWILYNYS